MAVLVQPEMLVYKTAILDSRGTVDRAVMVIPETGLQPAEEQVVLVAVVVQAVLVVDLMLVVTVDLEQLPEAQAPLIATMMVVKAVLVVDL